MELNLSKQDEAFRDEVRNFIAANYPAEMRVPNPETDLTKEQSLLWHRILYRKGWIAPLWPKEYGGPGWTITQRYIFERETSRAGTLPPLAFGVTMFGPLIYTFGNDAQKKRFLPPQRSSSKACACRPRIYWGKKARRPWRWNVAGNGRSPLNALRRSALSAN